MANKAGVEFDDKAWYAATKEHFQQTRVDLKKENHDLGEKTASSARRLAPRAEDHDPKEPILADSITVEDGTEGDMPYTEVGTSVRHGLYQEFGTSIMDAHPYMRPAIEENLT